MNARFGARFGIIGVLASCEARPVAHDPPGPIIGLTGAAEEDPQRATVRRGTIVVDGLPRTFWLRGKGDLDSPYTTIAIDRDGNGVAGPVPVAGESTAQRKIREWDDPEVIQLFEQTINLGAHTYDVAVDGHGDRLTLTPRASRAPDRAALQVGATAPDFAFDDLEGHPTQLSALRGRPVLIDFWSTTCVQCIEAMPRLAAIYQRHHPAGFEILGIAGDTIEDLRNFFATQPHVGRVALDDDQTSARYRVGWWPSYFLVDADGKIAVSRGSLDQVADYLDHAHGRK